jgi:hypothetical protein
MNAIEEITAWNGKKNGVEEYVAEMNRCLNKIYRMDCKDVVIGSNKMFNFKRAEFDSQLGIYSFYIAVRLNGYFKMTTTGKDTFIYKNIEKNWVHVSEKNCSKLVRSLAKMVEQDPHHAFSMAKPLNYE